MSISFQRLKRSVQPSLTWGPALNEDRVSAGYSKLVSDDEHGCEKPDKESKCIELATTKYDSF